MNPSGENRRPSDSEFEKMCDLFPNEDPSLLHAVLYYSGSTQHAIENVFKLKEPPPEENKHREELKSFEEEIGDYDICDVDKILVSLKHSQLPTTLPQQYPRQINNVMDSFSVSTSTSRPASKAPSIKSPIGTTKFKITSQMSTTNNNKCGSAYSSDSESFYSAEEDDELLKTDNEMSDTIIKSSARDFQNLKDKKIDQKLYNMADPNVDSKKTEKTALGAKAVTKEIITNKGTEKKNQQADCESNHSCKGTTGPEVNSFQQPNFNKNNVLESIFSISTLRCSRPTEENGNQRADETSRGFRDDPDEFANIRSSADLKRNQEQIVLTSGLENEDPRPSESSTNQCNNKEPTYNQNDHSEQFDSMKDTTKKQIYLREYLKKSSELGLHPTDIMQLKDEHTNTSSFTTGNPSGIVKDRNHVLPSTLVAVAQEKLEPSTSYTNAAYIKKIPVSYNSSVAQKAPEEKLPLSNKLEIGMVAKHNEDNQFKDNRLGAFSVKLKNTKGKDEECNIFEKKLKLDSPLNTVKAGQTTRNMSQEAILNRFFLSKEHEIHSKEPESSFNIDTATTDDIADLKREVVPTMDNSPKIEKFNMENEITCTLYSIGHYHLTVKANIIKNLPVGEYFAIPMAEYFKKGYSNLNKPCEKGSANETPFTMCNEDIMKEMDKDQLKLPNEKTAPDMERTDTSESYYQNDCYNDVLFQSSSLSANKESKDVKTVDNYIVDFGDPAEILPPAKYSGNFRNSQESIKDEMEQQKELMKIFFRDMDKDLIQEKVYGCGGDSEKFRDLFHWEKIKLDKVKRNEGAQRNELSHLLQKLPHLDPDYVEAKWFEIAGDEEKQNDFITTELLMKKEADLKELLRTRLPHLSKAQLEELSALFSNDELNLELFIAKETERQEVNNLIATAEEEGVDMDENEILDIWNITNGDAGAVLEFIEKKKQNMSVIISALSILPDVEPTFLMDLWEEAGGDSSKFNTLIAGYVERNDYPKIQNEDPQVRSRISLWNKYVENFDVIHYLQCVKDPVEKFITNAGKTAADFKYVEKFLKERYNGAELDFENLYVNQFNSQLAKFCKAFDTIVNPTSTAVSLSKDDLPEKFLQEITDHLAALKIAREDLITRARVDNVLLVCQCCFDDLLPEEGIPCPRRHLFCENCVIRACEMKLEENNSKIKCLTDCDKFFTLPVLREVLPTSLMMQLEKKQQLEEIAEAGVIGLEYCQYCEFCCIPAAGDRVFVCQNPECRKQTCRLCKKPAHIPFRCKEGEKSLKIQSRPQIEKTMTNSMSRTFSRLMTFFKTRLM